MSLRSMLGNARWRWWVADEYQGCNLMNLVDQTHAFRRVLWRNVKSDD